MQLWTLQVANTEQQKHSVVALQFQVEQLQAKPHRPMQQGQPAEALQQVIQQLQANLHASEQQVEKLSQQLHSQQPEVCDTLGHARWPRN